MTVALPLRLHASLILLCRRRTFLRSRVTERVGKSANQLMTGHEHPHWLTMLGFSPQQPQRS
jgi:hypothetical protein